MGKTLPEMEIPLCKTSAIIDPKYVFICLRRGPRKSHLIEKLNHLIGNLPKAYKT